MLSYEFIDSMYRTWLYDYKSACFNIHVTNKDLYEFKSKWIHWMFL